MQIVNPLSFQGWDELLLATPGCGFFHCRAWAKVLWETYHYRPAYFLATEQGKVTTLVPLMEIASLVTGRRGVSLPFSDDCEPIFPEGMGAMDALRPVIEHAKKSRWKYIELRGGSGPFQGIPTSAQYYGHTLDLTPGLESVHQRLRSNTRRNIEKAQREKVVIERGQSEESVREYFRLHCLTRKHHGLPPQPYRFFQNIHRHVIAQGQGVALLALHDGRYIAGAVYFHFGKDALYKFGASDPAFLPLRANNLIMWKAIEWFAQHGYSNLSLGRTDLSHEGLRSYKLGWGTQEKMLNYYRYDLRRNTFVAREPAVSLWANRVFRAMPIPLLRLLGSWLYRHTG